MPFSSPQGVVNHFMARGSHTALIRFERNWMLNLNWMLRWLPLRSGAGGDWKLGETELNSWELQHPSFISLLLIVRERPAERQANVLPHHVPPPSVESSEMYSHFIMVKVWSKVALFSHSGSTFLEVILEIMATVLICLTKYCSVQNLLRECWYITMTKCGHIHLFRHKLDIISKYGNQFTLCLEKLYWKLNI